MSLLRAIFLQINDLLGYSFKKQKFLNMPSHNQIVGFPFGYCHMLDSSFPAEATG